MAGSRRSGEGGRAPAGAHRRRSDDDRANERDERNAGDEEEYEEYEEGALSARDAGEAGLRHLTGIIAKTVEGITAVRPNDDGWTVEVEVLDAKHIPSSSDTLALYEIEIDDAGELMSYRRSAQYSRAKGREAP